MTTETTSRPISRFAEKLSAFRAGLNKDEQNLLDSMVSGDVEAHAAAVGWYGKAVSDKTDDVVEAHAMSRNKFAPKTSESDDVEAHARLPKAAETAARQTFKFNAARAAYEIDGGEDVEAHALRTPRAVDGRAPAATR
ncbi:MAG: hypothetical protein Fur0022_20460 [Anaerolineales bacterium]